MKTISHFNASNRDLVANDLLTLVSAALIVSAALAPRKWVNMDPWLEGTHSLPYVGGRLRGNNLCLARWHASLLQ